MPSRRRQTWKPDRRGYYTRQLGWKLSGTGKLQQHKFILGTDRREAEKRDQKLQELWDIFAGTRSEPRPLWTDDLLHIASQIAKGATRVPVPRQGQSSPAGYAERIERLQSRYPVVHFTAEDEAAYALGRSMLAEFRAVPVSDKAMINFSQMMANISVREREAMRRAESVLAEVGLSLGGLPRPVPTEKMSQPHLFGVLRPCDAVPPQTTSPSRSESQRSGAKPIVTPPATLHRAFQAYQEHLRTEYHRPEIQQVSAWGQTQIRQVETLAKHHLDIPLSTLDADAVSEMVGYWRRRPNKWGTEQLMTSKSAGNYLGTLKRFLNWLHTTSKFDWKKPVALSDLDTRVRRLPSDYARRSLEQVDTFTLDELKLLMRYGQPIDRLLLLLGLNCGFGAAEVSSLLVGEIRIRQAHTAREQEILGFNSTNEDSFIKRIRRKSGVYGEHILFPQTVQAVEWAIQQRRSFPEFGPDARLLLNQHGHAFDKPTRTGNANQSIPNHWKRLLTRIRKDDGVIRELSFGKLRKTASDLIRRFSDGEIAAVFDCHGKPVGSDNLSDVYTNRPFGKVFRAIRDVQTYLSPVFAEAGENPFAEQPQAYTKRSTVDRITEFHEAGVPARAIAKEVGVSLATVKRHVARRVTSRNAQR